jgi:hypothetical protein
MSVRAGMLPYERKNLGDILSVWQDLYGPQQCGYVEGMFWIKPLNDRRVFSQQTLYVFPGKHMHPETTAFGAGFRQFPGVRLEMNIPWGSCRYDQVFERRCE